VEALRSDMDKERRRYLIDAASAVPLIATIPSGSAIAMGSTRQCMDTTAQPAPITPEADRYIRIAGKIHSYTMGTTTIGAASTAKSGYTEDESDFLTHSQQLELSPESPTPNPDDTDENTTVFTSEVSSTEPILNGSVSQTVLTFQIGDTEYLEDGSLFQHEPYWQEDEDSPKDSFFLYLFETDEYRTDAVKVGSWPVYKLESSDRYTALTGSCWCSINPMSNECAP
jgi:hypothetical protein